MHSDSNLLTFTQPLSYVRVDVPILITILITDPSDSKYLLEYSTNIFHFQYLVGNLLSFLHKKGEAVEVIIGGLSSSIEKVNEIIDIVDEYELSAKEATIILSGNNQESFINFLSEMTPKQAVKLLEYDIEDEKIPNFLKLLDDEEDENGKLKSGFARPLTEEEAAYILDLTEAGEVLDSPITRVHINRFIELVDSYISFEDAESLIIDDEKFNRYLDLRTEKEDLTPQEAFFVAINDIRDEHISDFLMLLNLLAQIYYLI